MEGGSKCFEVPRDPDGAERRGRGDKEARCSKSLLSLLVALPATVMKHPDRSSLSKKGVFWLTVHRFTAGR